MELRSFSATFQELVERVDPAVVQVIARGFVPPEGATNLLRSQRGSGSGVIVDANGYIVTNAHVVGLARRVDVLLPQPAEESNRFHSVLKPNGKLVPATVIGMDQETDVAVLKIEQKGLAALRFADSEAVRQGQIVLAFGSPFGLENSVTMGIVSSVARQVRRDDPMIYIQTDASINPGNSGGPLVNADGELVGINTFILSQSGGNEGIGFAAPSNIVRYAYEQIREHGRVRRGQIGIVPQTITPELALAMKLPQDYGVLISDVAPGGAADTAGLKVRDIVLRADGREMENARQFGLEIYRRAGKSVNVEVWREGKKLPLTIAVLERPKDPDRMLSLVRPESNVPRLGILVVELDEKATPLLPPVRRLSGVVVAGVVSELARGEDQLMTGDVIYEVNNERVSSVAEFHAAMGRVAANSLLAVQIERMGQLQFLLLESH
jgi:serine protease Do